MELLLRAHRGDYNNEDHCETSLTFTLGILKSLLRQEPTDSIRETIEILEVELADLRNRRKK